MTAPRRRRAPHPGWLAALILPLLLAGCSAPSEDAQSLAEPAADVEPFYEQEPEWAECDDDSSMECATVEVPVDYSAPQGESIDLAVARSAEADPDQPVMLINPGGPGGSGVDMVADQLDYVSTSRLREAYTIVGFDPRGVSRSAPVECLNDEQMDAQRQIDADPSTADGLDVMREASAELAAACEENTGEILGFVDTASSAQDMDVLRAVLSEDEALNYLGFSYGTKLGATYADLFPENVGRMVLDGALDPSLPEEEVTLGQAAGFEQALASWSEWCAGQGGCNAGSTPDEVVETVRDVLAEVEQDPMTAQDGRSVPASTFVTGFITPLYSEQSWPSLAVGFNEALDGDPSTLLQFADLNAGRDADGNYSSNIQSAFTAINCLDYPTHDDEAAMTEHAAELDEASPTFGQYLAYGGVACSDWPYEPTNLPQEMNAEGSAPIVVIGTTGDPATPYEWSSRLAEQLDSGVMVTNEGEGHGAYSPTNSCIASLVDEYFIEGTVPEDGVTC